MGPMKQVFILHGWTKSAASWDEAVACLRAKGLDVTLPKIPGLTDDTDPVWGLNDYVEWLSQLLPSDPVVLVGHSNGGRIAVAFTAAYPHRVQKLILVDSAGIPLTDPWVKLKLSVFKGIAHLGRKLTNSEKLQSLLYRAARVSDYPNSTPNMRKTMANLIALDLTERLSRISVPTLIIWGQNDSVTPLHMAHKLHQGIKDSRLEIIPSARHAPHATHPNKVCELIYNFSIRSDLTN